MTREFRPFLRSPRPKLPLSPTNHQKKCPGAEGQVDEAKPLEEGEPELSREHTPDKQVLDIFFLLIAQQISGWMREASSS